MSSVVNPPKNWDECLRLLRSDDLDLALQVRLVDLAFHGQDSVAVKAIEILRGMAKPERDDPLANVPVEVLKEQRRLADEWLSKLAKQKH